MRNIALFVFYNTSSGYQRVFNFSREFQHCKVITYDGQYMITHYLNAAGMHTEIVKKRDIRELVDLLRRIPSVCAIVATSIDRRAAKPWTPLLLRSCNEHARMITGINTGLTWNPKHLYKRLDKCEGRQYKIIYHWRRKDGEQ